MPRIAVNILLCGVMASGCSKSLRRNDDLSDPNFYFNRGMERFEDKKYLDAAEEFETVVNSFSTSPIVDHAQFMLAESNYKAEEYLTAAFEYERVYMDYPSSPYAAQAQFNKARCYFNESPRSELDQENTRLAIAEFLRFIANYPQDEQCDQAQEFIEELREKLAYKDYRNAEIYRKMKNYDAAVIYYEDVISTYPRAVWADYARMGVARVRMVQGRYDEAESLAMIVVNNEDDRDLKEQASRLLEDIESERQDAEAEQQQDSDG
jgi:outer membrane protein assembly factor BamD